MTKAQWQTVALAEVATIERSAIQPADIAQGTAYLGLEHIESGGRIIRAKPVDEGELASSKFKFTAQHVLYGKLRPYLAKISCPDFNGICSTDILPILPGPKLERRFLCHFLLQPTMVDYANSQAAGANLPRLSPTTLAQFEIPLPPLAEQRRIAEVLDRAEALRAKRRAALAQLDALTQSLFLDLFGDPVANERKWPFHAVNDFVAGFESGKSIVADDEDDTTSPYRVLKVSAVTSLEFRPEQSKAMPPDYEPPQSHIVRAGDLLFSRANTAELIGATAYVSATPPNLLLPDKLWRFVWHDEPKANPHFVRFLFQQPKFRREITQRASGTSGSMKNISQDKVLTIKVGLPPLALQREFARRVTAVESLKTAQRAALAELDALFATVQHRAFRGEL
jgi:type I restriction enzyme S subunit